MVTTVPAMVLVVIALGIGVCRIVGDGDFFVSYSGVYLALYHYNADGYYGQPAYKGVIATTHAPATNAADEQCAEP
ncbi:MAG: hypothetical protein MKZ98_01130 [Pseudomonadales bacterium]|nr:hypothetical protein [Pseudomonadales bacterium]